MCWTLYIREFKREESKSMILADKTIRELNSKNEITIEPIGEKTIQPASVDLSLGTSWSQPIVRSNGRTKLTELSEADNWSWHDEKMLITPGAFVLATTRERVRLPANVAGMISGRSSVGRAGLFVENAGYVDPGFDGHITLELYNASPNTIEIEAGTRVAQLILIQMDGAAAEPYAGKYNGQTDATPSKMAEDKDTIKADHDPIRGTFVTPDIQDHDLFNERRSLLKDKEDLIAANKLLQEQLKPEKKKHVKTAEEIAEWCGSRACAVCNHMQIDDEGYCECDLEIYRVEPCFWSRHVIATLDRIMTFESQADTIVEDTEDDQ